MKMHLTEGQIRAYQDGELPESKQKWVRAHLVECARCQSQADEIAARSERVGRHMSILAPAKQPMPARVARARLDARITENTEKERTMWHKLFRGRYRPAWAALAVIAVLAISMSFPQVRAIASRFLELFRVERITAVQVGIDLGELPGEMEELFTALQPLLGDQIRVEELVEPVEVQDAAEASALAGFPVRLPAGLGGPRRMIHQPAKTVHFVIERDRWQALLDEMGYDDFVIPESADGSQVTIHIPDTVAALYGECAPVEDEEMRLREQPEDCTILVQSHNPSVEVPPELDLNRMGEIFLEVLGMSPEDAAEFSSRVDWLTTLVIPVPQGAAYHNVPNVDGVSGIALEDPTAAGASRYTLVWLKDGLLYGLAGVADIGEATRVANSLR